MKKALLLLFVSLFLFVPVSVFADPIGTDDPSLGWIYNLTPFELYQLVKTYQLGGSSMHPNAVTYNQAYKWMKDRASVWTGGEPWDPYSTTANTNNQWGGFGQAAEQDFNRWKSQPFGRQEKDLSYTDQPRSSDWGRPWNPESEMGKRSRARGKVVAVSSFANLTLTNPVLSPSKPAYLKSEQVRVSAVIRNTDKGDSGSYIIVIRNKNNGSILGRQIMNGLKPSQSVNFSYTLRSLNGSNAGQNNLEIVVDPDNDIIESKEDDNSTNVSLNIILPKPADLVINSITLSPRKSAYTKADSRVNVRATIRNLGETESGSYVVIVRNKNDNSVIAELPQSNLKPKKVLNFAYTMPNFNWSVEGDNTIEVLVDTTNMVNESNETNNSAAVLFKIKPSQATPSKKVIFLDNNKSGTAGVFNFFDMSFQKIFNIFK
ncbi:MAG: CARDB domain-containing protein [bacterium]|nr:CARDB domain-containing protein [bacterium]